VGQLGDLTDQIRLQKFLEYDGKSIWSEETWDFGLSLLRHKPPDDDEVRQFIIDKIKLLRERYPVVTRSLEMQGACGWGAADISQRSF